MRLATITNAQGVDFSSMPTSLPESFQAKVRAVIADPYSIRYSYPNQVVRWALAIMHGWICGMCGGPISDISDLHIDHITPRALGGGHGFSNLRPTHQTCNTAAGGRLKAALARSSAHGTNSVT